MNPQFIPYANGFLLTGFSLGILYFALLFFFNSRIESENRCKLRNSFPYEVYASIGMRSRLVLYLVIALDALSLSLGFSFFFLYLGTTYSYLIMAALFFAPILGTVSNLTPLSSYKTHLVSTLLAIGLFSLSFILVSFITVIPGGVVIDTQVSLPIVVVLGAIGFVSLFSLFNRKLLDWAKLDKTEENGKTYYVKPKVNYLSLYEWIFLALINLSALLLFINLAIATTAVQA